MLPYIDEFRNASASAVLAAEIAATMKTKSRVTLMEVCGTHTMSIHRHGIKQLLPENLRLLSGPGCPVCVTPNDFIDRAIALSRVPDIIITTFGDMIRVPGSSSSLEKERGAGADVRVVSSTLEAVRIAQEERDRRVIFLGVGFETTAPTIAASIVEAERLRLTNYFVLSAHKIIPPALKILSGGIIDVDGFICPAHVSAIIGSKPYEFLPRDFGKACVITGFEPLDILQGIRMLMRQIASGAPKLEVQYDRVVRPDGNRVALDLLDEVFEVSDSDWRGMGSLPLSGLRLRERYAQFDAARMIEVAVELPREPKGCICGSVIQGLKDPPECKLFGTACTPVNPVGACMVSSEGTCAAWFKYAPERREDNPSGVEHLVEAEDYEESR
jgi:hydrogenase expression/formation protein HypD